MTVMKRFAAAAVLLALGGCATFPMGPSVTVMPQPGQPFKKFQSDDAQCRQFAEQQQQLQPQKAYEQNTATGAVAGSVLGGALGAAIGAGSNHLGSGAVIGAVGGALLGTAAGSESGKVYGAEAQRRYDAAYEQCMSSHNYEIRGTKNTPVVVARPVAPPPVIAVPPAIEHVEPPRLRLPESYFEVAPEFVFSPALNLYVTADGPYDLFYTGREYYFYEDGAWYRSAFYNGPWTYVEAHRRPQVFTTIPIREIRYYREGEYRRYQRDRARYDGRVFRPEYRPLPRYR